MLFGLDAKLRRAYDEIPSDLKSGDLMTSKWSSNAQRNAMLLFAIYYCCEITLHSSIVPIFSGSTVRMDISPTLIDSCRTTAVQAATAFAKMIRRVILISPDFSKVATFVAYAAFTAGSVLAILSTSQRQGQQRASWYAHGLACLLELKEMKEYFPGLAGMVSSLSRTSSSGNQP